MSPRVLFEPIGERSTAARTRPSSTPPSARATTSSTAAAKGSARPASASCSRARWTLRPYSTFALSETRRRTATRCCAGRCPTQDLVGRAAALRPRRLPAREPHPRRAGAASSRSEDLTHDIRRLDAASARSPGTSRSCPASTSTSGCRASDDARRSFSMANLPGDGLDRADRQVLPRRALLGPARRRGLRPGDELALHRSLRRVPPARVRRARC